MRKKILITGASAGLGEGMAREFAAMGRDLALCARRLGPLEALKTELEAAHGIRVAIRALDVNDHAQVFKVFRELAQELGGLDRVIVNAGLGKGVPIGLGGFKANLQTAQTNFIAALAQCEAALEIFREQRSGHLVTISSMSAMRGMPRAATTYAATKAGLAALTEGIRLELVGTPIKVTTIFPGYIRTEINAKVKNTPFMVERDVGCRAMVRAIEREGRESFVPAWPWSLIGFAMKRMPLDLIARVRS